MNYTSSTKIDWSSKNFTHLCEDGFDIDKCYINFCIISVKPLDIARYKKAFRIKIREFLKLNDTVNLTKYIDKFYEFALFVRYCHPIANLLCSALII